MSRCAEMRRAPGTHRDRSRGWCGYRASLPGAGRDLLSPDPRARRLVVHGAIHFTRATQDAVRQVGFKETDGVERCQIADDRLQIHFAPHCSGVRPPQPGRVDGAPERRESQALAVQGEPKA